MSDPLAETLARMRADYVRRVQGDLEHMEQLWREVLADGRAPSARLEELIRIAHSISGSGATFGLPAASSAGHELEYLLEALRQQAKPPDADARARVADLFDALRASAPGS